MTTKRTKLGLFVAISAMITIGSLISACGDKEKEDLFHEGIWEYVHVNDNDSLVVILDNYPKEHKFLSKVHRTGTDLFVVFQNDTWNTYKIENNTIWIDIKDIGTCSWTFRKVSENTIRLEYEGMRFDPNFVFDYTFTRKKD